VALAPPISQSILRERGRTKRPASPSSFRLIHDPEGTSVCSAARRRIRPGPKRNGRSCRRIGRIRSFRASTVCRNPSCIERWSLCPPSRRALAYWRSQWLQVQCDRPFLFAANRLAAAEKCSWDCFGFFGPLGPAGSNPGRDLPGAAIPFVRLWTRSLAGDRDRRSLDTRTTTI
jgi:hypothetical protein